VSSACRTEIAGSCNSYLDVPEHEGKRTHSRDLVCPGCAISLSLSCEVRAQGKPGADCARSTVCDGSERKHTGLTGTAETSRLSPRNGFTAYTCSPRGSGLSCPRCRRETSADVAPGSRRQDHTTSPSAAVFRPAAGLDPFRNQAVTPEIAASIASLAQRIVTIAKRPSVGRDAGLIPQIRIPVKRNIFDFGT
jgi:hypothetical protein